MRSGNVHVNTPEEYAKVAIIYNPNNHMKFISKTDIEAGEQHLNAERDNAITIPQT